MQIPQRRFAEGYSFLIGKDRQLLHFEHPNPKDLSKDQGQTVKQGKAWLTCAIPVQIVDSHCSSLAPVLRIRGSLQRGNVPRPSKRNARSTRDTLFPPSAKVQSCLHDHTDYSVAEHEANSLSALSLPKHCFYWAEWIRCIQGRPYNI